jgi:hypothetical protein
MLMKMLLRAQPATSFERFRQESCCRQFGASKQMYFARGLVILQVCPELPVTPDLTPKNGLFAF